MVYVTYTEVSFKEYERLKRAKGTESIEFVNLMRNSPYGTGLANICLWNVHKFLST